MNPKDHPKWPVFETYAKNNGIDLEHEDDWMPWWECWFHGFCTANVKE